MTIIDDRTTNLSLQKPNAANLLSDDVARLRAALDAIDAAIFGKQAALGFTPENAANKGAANGYAPLGADQKVPAANLPSYVDDVLEYATTGNFPATGETGKIYVATGTGKCYRWSGSAYVEISASPGSTDAVPEGSTNLYFTNARAVAAVPVATASVAGKVKPGSGLSVTGDGTVSVDGAGQTYTDIPLTISSNGQTVFNVTGGYNPGALDVYLNGVKLVGGGDDYTAANGTSITLTVGAQTTPTLDTLIVRKWSTFQVANAVDLNSNQTVGGVKTFTGPINESEGAAIASAGTINLDTATGNFVHITGTTTISAMTLAQGAERTLVFDGVLTLTHSANLFLSANGANITTAVNDVAIFRGEGSGVTRLVAYTRADGQAVAGGSVAQIQPISASVGSNALTISASALSLDFRSTTLGSGAVTRVSGTPANLVISSGSTLGTVNGVMSRIAVLAINNAGTIELAAVNMAGGNNLDETTLISTTAEGGAGAADSANVIYSTSASSNVPFRVIGYIESTQTTAGTWAAAPSTIQGAGGNALTAMSSLGYGQTWQSPSRALATTYYNTTGRPVYISVEFAASAQSGRIIVNGVTVSEAYSAGLGTFVTIAAVIPPSASYSVTGTVTLTRWLELR